VVFERAVANGLWTFPAVATLLTGLLPSGHGVISIQNGSAHPDFGHRFSDVLDARLLRRSL
jgi:arylsulfatase A-like enzyme